MPSTTVDDPFDSIVLAEERTYRQAYEEGLLAGRAKAEREGRATGMVRGAALGQELGYYWGLLLASKVACINSSNKKTDRAAKEISRLVDMLESIAARADIVDPADQAFFDEVDHVRAKFKQVASLLNLSTSGANRVGAGGGTSPLSTLTF